MICRVFYRRAEALANAMRGGKAAIASDVQARFPMIFPAIPPAFSPWGFLDVALEQNWNIAA
jgi:hypothetical protein